MLPNRYCLLLLVIDFPHIFSETSQIISIQQLSLVNSSPLFDDLTHDRQTYTDMMVMF